jgi:hypothetical protein
MRLFEVILHVTGKRGQGRNNGMECELLNGSRSDMRKILLGSKTILFHRVMSCNVRISIYTSTPLSGPDPPDGGDSCEDPAERRIYYHWYTHRWQLQLGQ